MPASGSATRHQPHRGARFAGVGLGLLGVVIAVWLLRPAPMPNPGFLGRPASSWVHDLGSPDFEVRATARRALTTLGAPATRQIIAALRTPDVPFRRMIERFQRRYRLRLVESTDRSSIREQAAQVLSEPWAADPEAITALVLALRDRSPNVVREAEASIRRHGAASVSVLRPFLADRDARLRLGAARVLADLGPLAVAAVADLSAACMDRDAAVRCQCVRALGAMSSMDAVQSALLVSILQDAIPAVRIAAAEVLGSNTKPEQTIVAALRTALSDTVPGVRVAAARSLFEIAHEVEDVVPVLAGALPDRDAGWRAAFVLGEIGPQAAGAIPALIEALRREQGPRPLREAPSSAFALGQMGVSAVPALIPLLAHETPRVRTSAAIALGFIGSRARAAAPDLARLMKDKDAEARQAAVLSLSAVRPDTEGLAAALLEMSRDDDIYISNAAASALEKIDPVAAMGLPAR